MNIEITIIVNKDQLDKIDFDPRDKLFKNFNHIQVNNNENNSRVSKNLNIEDMQKKTNEYQNKKIDNTSQIDS